MDVKVKRAMQDRAGPPLALPGVHGGSDIGGR
jgi:hypothetical protein